MLVEQQAFDCGRMGCSPDSGEDWPVACLVPYLDVICLVWSEATDYNLILDCLNSLVVQ